jgi:hypothetical protein
LAFVDFSKAALGDRKVRFFDFLENQALGIESGSFGKFNQQLDVTTFQPRFDGEVQTLAMISHQ